MSHGGPLVPQLTPNPEKISKIERTASLALIMKKYHGNPGVNWMKNGIATAASVKHLNAIVLQGLWTTLKWGYRVFREPPLMDDCGWIIHSRTSKPVLDEIGTIMVSVALKNITIKTKEKTLWLHLKWPISTGHSWMWLVTLNTLGEVRSVIKSCNVMWLCTSIS